MTPHRNCPLCHQALRAKVGFRTIRYQCSCGWTSVVTRESDESVLEQAPASTPAVRRAALFWHHVDCRLHHPYKQVSSQKLLQYAVSQSERYRREEWSVSGGASGSRVP